MNLFPAQVEAYKRDGYIGTIDVMDEPAGRRLPAGF